MFELVKTHWFGPIYIEEWRHLETGAITFKLGGLFFPSLDEAKDEIAKVYGSVPV